MKPATIKRLLMTFSLLLAVNSSHAEIINTEPLDGELDAFCAELLQKILNYGGGSYELQNTNNASSQIRDIVSLEKNIIDVTWIATSKDYEKRIRPIRIPIYKGLLGYRLYVITKSNKALFEQVKTLDDLKKLSIGQGLGWVDADILKANGFTVLGALNHKQLYTMLMHNRFDSLLRGLHEPWAEIRAFNDPSIVVEENYLIHYPMPMYFFVNNNNEKLAKLIEENFNKMIDDGVFDEILHSDGKIKEAIEKANLSERKLFRLKNPSLPDETPLNEKKYWYDINQ